MKANTETLNQKLEVIAENKEYLESGDYELGNGGFRDFQRQSTATWKSRS